MSASHFTEEDLAAAKRRRELEEKIDRDDRLTPAARTVGRELLRWVHREIAYAWLSASKLAATLKLCTRTAERGLAQLERCGYFVGERRQGQTTLYRPVYEVPAKAPTSVKMSEVTSVKMSDHLRQKRPRTSVKMSDKSLLEISKKNLSEAPPPPSPPAVEAQQAADKERKTIDLTATPPDEGLARALASFAACKPSASTAADQVTAVITDKPIPTAAIDVTSREAPMLTLTPVADETVSPEWDVCLQLAAEWGGINLDRAVQLVTAMTAKLPIERVHHQFSKVAALHRSGRKKLDMVERGIAKEFAVLHPAQGDFFAPSPWSATSGATSPPAGAAPPPQALVFDLAALRQYAAQIAAWRPDLDASTAQRMAKEWMAGAGVNRLRQPFATVAARKRSGAFKFGWIEDRVANPRPLRPARRQARGSSA
jgi:hypothetical protein